MNKRIKKKKIKIIIKNFAILLNLNGNVLNVDGIP